MENLVPVPPVGPGPSIARVCFTVVGGVVNVNYSVNVTDVVRNGAGDYTISFTTAFSNENYLWAINAGQGLGGVGGCIVNSPAAQNPLVTSFRFQTNALSVIAGALTLTDAAFVSAQFFGQ
jgi:hypothetical protein